MNPANSRKWRCSDGYLWLSSGLYFLLWKRGRNLRISSGSSSTCRSSARPSSKWCRAGSGGTTTKKMVFFKNPTSGHTATLLLLFFLLPITAALFLTRLKRSNRHSGSRYPPSFRLETSTFRSKFRRRLHCRISISTCSQLFPTFAELAKKKTQESRDYSRGGNEIADFHP